MIKFIEILISSRRCSALSIIGAHRTLRQHTACSDNQAAAVKASGQPCDVGILQHSSDAHHFRASVSLAQLRHWFLESGNRRFEVQILKLELSHFDLQLRILALESGQIGCLWRNRPLKSLHCRGRDRYKDTECICPRVSVSTIWVSMTSLLGTKCPDEFIGERMRDDVFHLFAQNSINTCNGHDSHVDITNWMETNEYSPCELEAWIKQELQILRQSISALPPEHQKSFQEILEEANLLELRMFLGNMTLCQ